MRTLCCGHAPSRSLGGVALAIGLQPGSVPAEQAAGACAQPRHLFMLVRGLFGFSSIGPVCCVFGVPAAPSAGGATVFTSAVAA